MRKGLRLGIALAGSLAAWAAAADAAASHVTILPGKSQVEDISATQLGEFRGSTRRARPTRAAPPIRDRSRTR